MARPQRHHKIPQRYIADDFLCDGPFQLLFCEKTESFHIVARKHVTTVRQGLATVIKDGVLARGIVKFSGSRKQCESEQKKLERIYSEEKENAAEANLIEEATEKDEQSYPASPSSRSMGSRTDEDNLLMLDEAESDEVVLDADNATDDDDDDTDDESAIDPSSMSSPVRSTGPKRRINFQSSVAVKRPCHRAASRTVSDMPLSEVDLNSVENMLSRLSNKFETSIKNVNKKIEELTRVTMNGRQVLDAYCDRSGEVFPVEVMFNGQNLLDVMGQNYGEYARKLMKVIFSAEDLKTRILPPARGHLAREALEQSSFNVLLGAVRAKYRFDKALFGSFYKNLLRRKLSDFLLDERRREERREERQRTRTTANMVTSAF